MKIKVGFITNSSSCTFIILDIYKNRNLKEMLKKYDEEFSEFDLIYNYNYFNSDEIEEIKTFSNYGEELDWIQKVSGPVYGRFGNKYIDIIKSVKEGKNLHYITVDEVMDLEQFAQDTDGLELVYSGHWEYDK